jgi:hypothetical protein
MELQYLKTVRAQLYFGAQSADKKTLVKATPGTFLLQDSYKIGNTSKLLEIRKIRNCDFLSL